MTRWAAEMNASGELPSSGRPCLSVVDARNGAVIQVCPLGRQPVSYATIECSTNALQRAQSAHGDCCVAAAIGCDSIGCDSTPLPSQRGFFREHVVPSGDPASSHCTSLLDL